MEPFSECCERAAACPGLLVFIETPRACLWSGVEDPGVGGRGYGYGGLAVTDGRRVDGTGALCASDDVDRLNGLRSAGYAWRSSGGTGGAACAAAAAASAVLVVALLKAFRIDANDGFFVKADVVVPVDGCDECAKVVLELFRSAVNDEEGAWNEYPESCDATELPREWKKSRSCDPTGVESVGESGPDADDAPKPKCPALRPKGIEDELKSSSSNAACR